MSFHVIGLTYIISITSTSIDNVILGILVGINCKIVSKVLNNAECSEWFRMVFEINVNFFLISYFSVYDQYYDYNYN